MCTAEPQNKLLIENQRPDLQSLQKDSNYRVASCVTCSVKMHRSTVHELKRRESPTHPNANRSVCRMSLKHLPLPFC